MTPHLLWAPARGPWVRWAARLTILTVAMGGGVCYYSGLIEHSLWNLACFITLAACSPVLLATTCRSSDEFKARALPPVTAVFILACLYYLPTTDSVITALHKITASTIVYGALALGLTTIWFDSLLFKHFRKNHPL